MQLLLILLTFTFKFTCQERQEKYKYYHQRFWKKYNSMGEINLYLRWLSANYDFVSVENIGQSYENRPMNVLKVSNQ